MGSITGSLLDTSRDHSVVQVLGGALLDGAIGGVAGVLGGAIGGKVAGSLLKTAAGGLLSRIGVGVAVGALSGAGSGALTGGAYGALEYAQSCGDGCNFADGARATAAAAARGAATSAVLGGALGGVGGGLARGCHSFAPGTRVLMADGSTRPIEDVNVGDTVKAADPVAGTTESKPVTALHLNRDTELTDVTVASSGVAAGSQSTSGKLGALVGAAVAVAGLALGAVAALHTTDHHQFWDQTTSAWTDAAKLRPGVSTLLTADGQTVTVTAVSSQPGDQLMRDLTVADTHTYYVVAGDTPVLVHNCNTSGVYKSEGLSANELEGAAIQTRDRFASEMSALSSKQRPNVAIGGYNSETGEFAAAASSSAGCAELCLINMLGGDASKVVRTVPVLLRPSNLLSPRPVCLACEVQFGRDNVAPETTFESDILRLFD